MNIKRSVFVTATFAGIHQWPECPFAEVKFLRELHRHIFHVEVRATVTHNNRDIEFITLKQTLEKITSGWQNENLGSQSCEMLAKEIMSRLIPDYPTVYYVSVSEDGENGAVIECEAERAPTTIDTLDTIRLRSI